MKLCFLLVLLALLGLAAPAAAQIAPVSSPTGPVMAGPYLVIDAATGETLLQQNAGAGWHPASLTKLMTMYIVFEELKAGRLQLSSPVVISPHARSMETGLGLAVGSKLTVEQALMALVVRSPNDVAAALGELVGSTEAQFAQRMNQTAARIGMTATQYRNASGLPNAEQVTTARDLGVLAMALIKDFPEYYGFFHSHEFMLGSRRVGPNVNKFVELYSPYAEGMKTGFICSSGFNLVGSATRDGRRLIGVALGFRRSDLRDEFMIRLLDEAFALKTGGNRPKVWQLRNEGSAPPFVMPYGQCGMPLYDMPGDAAWLGNYGDWPTAKRVFARGQADLATVGVTRPGKEWILEIVVKGAKRQAAIIADLEPGAAEKLCAAYVAKKQFCEVRKAADIMPPFAVFAR